MEVNGADGREPINNLAFHVGTSNDFIYCKARRPPKRNGVHSTEYILPMSFDMVIRSSSWVSINPLIKS